MVVYIIYEKLFLLVYRLNTQNLYNYSVITDVKMSVLEQMLNNIGFLLDEIPVNRKLCKEIEKNNVYILYGDSFAKEDKAVFLYGDTQSGKTTIKKQFLNNHSYKDMTEDVTFATYEEETMYIHENIERLNDKENLKQMLYGNTDKIPLRALIELNPISVEERKSLKENFNRFLLSDYTEQLNGLNKVLYLKHEIIDETPKQTYLSLKKILINALKLS
tara:strand:+ start:140 stop:793 length:654 start_codon:yes stop_codon:yes gene_type:complete